ncbi:MAG: FRG domain-containing protein [Actinomycetia bacterium]|nr:FRG domain-containing protein [Actinomycetes bacterium]
MRKIEPTLTKKLFNLDYDPKKIFAIEPLLVNKYTKLVEHTAKLAYLNKDYLLFFRGQCQDFKSKTGTSTFYPSIYRGEYVSSKELSHLFDLLNRACKKLVHIFKLNRMEGRGELRRKKYIQWSMLQHYEVCKTPLLDFTHSLRVACSFAQCRNYDKYGYVYIFGFPYITNRISINSEHDIVNIRLLSISPPDALRPYFQEGYLAGTTDITFDYDQKIELDFRNRLIMKFKIPNNNSFWGKEFHRIPDKLLFPRGDKILKLCKSLETDIKKDLQPGQLGVFLEEWSDLEAILKKRATDFHIRVYSFRQSIIILLKKELINRKTYILLDELRKFRNSVVHEPKKIDREDLDEYLKKINEVKKFLRNKDIK